MKIAAWTFLGALLLFASLQLFWLLPKEERAAGPGYDCPFCRESVIKSQAVYEGELVRVLVNFRPLVAGHSLIMPKRHVVKVEDLSPEEFAEMGETINKMQKAFQKVYGASDYLLVVQNGVNAGQTAFHVHFHMIPRKKASQLAKVYMWWMMMKRGFDFWMPVDWASVETQRAQLQGAMEIVSHSTQ
jgi:histidine triad (HIT) family protein